MILNVFVLEHFGLESVMDDLQQNLPVLATDIVFGVAQKRGYITNREVVGVSFV
jgi:hypothetical protein